MDRYSTIEDVGSEGTGRTKTDLPVEIRVTRLNVWRGEHEIIGSASFTVGRGEFVCILGLSGCGKSTLLRVLGGLLPYSGGEVLVADSPPASAWMHVSFVFQSPRLVRWRGALGNVLLGLELRFGRARANRSENRRRATELLELVGLGESQTKSAMMLSGGERQRVAIARALAVEPRILLMDEPFSALDVRTKQKLREELLEIWRRTERTILFVTHDIAEAVTLADRIIVLGDKPSHVLADLPVGAPRPRDLASADLGELVGRLLGLIGAESLDAT